MQKIIAKFVFVLLIFGLIACTSEEVSIPITKEAHLKSLILLKSLTFEGLTLDTPFNENITKYTASVAQNVKNIKVTPTRYESSQIIKVNDTIIKTGESINVDLKIGLNIIEVSITDNGLKKAYVFTITRSDDPQTNYPDGTILNNDTSLSLLTFSSGQLIPAFSSTIFDYTLVLDKGQSLITCTPTFNALSTASLNDTPLTSGNTSEEFQLRIGNNQLTITVSAEDKSSKDYTINAIRFDENSAIVNPVYQASLSNILISQGTLSPTFSTGIFDYVMSVDNHISQLQVTPTSTESNATITVNNGEVLSGNASNSIPLVVGSNKILIIVQAIDGTSLSYTIIVTREERLNTNLSSMTLSTGILDQPFQAAQLTYTANVGFTTDKISITATTENPASSITINGTPTNNNASSQTIDLIIGTTPIDITVTASNNVATSKYRLDVTRNPAAALTQKHYIKASNSISDTMSTPHFGISTAIDGDLLAIGSYKEGSASAGINQSEAYDCVNDINCALDSGAVYVFTQTDNLWAQEAYIKASNGKAGDEFGADVALEGDLLVVGSRFESFRGRHSGAVYVYRKNGTTWTEEAILHASNSGENFEFGTSVDISNGLIVVGSPYESSSYPNAGAAYVFAFDGIAWNQQTYLKASNFNENDLFGQTVAISDKLIAISATGESSSAVGINQDQTLNDAPNAGAVYVFSLKNNTWSQEAYLKASNTQAADLFGLGLDIDGNTLVSGARGQNGAETGINSTQSTSGKTESGAAYIYTRNDNGIWSQEAYLKASNSGSGDIFHTVSLSNNTLVIGAQFEDSSANSINGDDNNLAEDSGAAYVFQRTNQVWQQTHYLKPTNTEAGDRFGQSVATDGNNIVIGAPQEDGGETGITLDDSSNSKPNSGAAYLFQ